MKKPELVAPAGNPEKMRTAFQYGADSVYCAGKSFGLRAHAGNFTDQELIEAVSYAHELGKKLYVTVNVFARNTDIDSIDEYLNFLQSIDPDGIMVSDPGIIKRARTIDPSLPLALSTQANCTNREAAAFWAQQGISRIVLARELSINEIADICQTDGVEIEIFVQGALCISYSGRCFISRYMSGRDANQGDCTHSCRWEYALMEREREGEYFPIEEEPRYTYFFNSKDLCLVEYISDLIKAGVDAFKIEGRMKSISYVASSTAVYRDAIDTFFDDPDASVKSEWIHTLKNVSSRDFTEGFIRGHELPEDYDPDNIIDKEYERTEFCGKATGKDNTYTRIQARNQFKKGDRLEFFLPGMKVHTVTPEIIVPEPGQEEVEVINTNDICYIELPFDVPEGTIIRKILNPKQYQNPNDLNSK